MLHAIPMPGKRHDQYIHHDMRCYVVARGAGNGGGRVWGTALRQLLCDELGPLLLGPAGRDLGGLDTIYKNGGRDMNAQPPRVFDVQLELSRHGIATVARPGLRAKRGSDGDARKVRSFETTVCTIPPPA